MNNANNAGISASALRAFFEFDGNTGVFYKPLASGGKKMMGTIKSDGYVKLFFGGRQCSAHRLAWLYTHGEWPAGFIDHINGNRCDNRLCNLRDVTPQENSANKTVAARGKTSSQRVGVFLYKNCKTKPWTAQITDKGKRVYLGRFDSEQEAANAYSAYKQSQAQPGGLPNRQG